MTENYLSVSGECATEKTIEKSRFIATSRHVEGEEQAKSFISEIKSKYRGATHNCYAYIGDKTGNLLRFSDDGEPQGTAGMPMLEVLKSNKLREVAVVVTRYFGGIKLGAGGLARAYGSSVAENLDAARKVLYRKCVECSCTVAYTDYEAALRFLKENGIDLLNTEYLNEVVITIAVGKTEYADFSKKFINFLNGKVRIDFLKEYFFCV